MSEKGTEDRDRAILKFQELIDKANAACNAFKKSRDGSLPGDLYFELRVSSINLLTRLASEDSVYVQELKSMHPNVFSIKGVLEAARVDYLQGLMTDHKLLISAEVFSDLLVQAEILLEHNYKDAAAVLIRAVLEDGLRKLCEARKMKVERLDTIGHINGMLYKQNVYSALQHKEITAKTQIGNYAAHGRFDQYSKADVAAFLEFVLRFLAQYLR